MKDRGDSAVSEVGGESGGSGVGRRQAPRQRGGDDFSRYSITLLNG